MITWKFNAESGKFELYKDGKLIYQDKCYDCFMIQKQAEENKIKLEVQLQPQQ